MNTVALMMVMTILLVLDILRRIILIEAAAEYYARHHPTDVSFFSLLSPALSLLFPLHANN